jgi:hypothetical protein
MTPEEFTSQLRQAGFTEFQLLRGMLHTERYGAAVVRYLVGRR